MHKLLWTMVKTVTISAVLTCLATSSSAREPCFSSAKKACESKRVSARMCKGEKEQVIEACGVSDRNIVARATAISNARNNIIEFYIKTYHLKKQAGDVKDVQQEVERMRANMREYFWVHLKGAKIINEANISGKAYALIGIDSKNHESMLQEIKIDAKNNEEQLKRSRGRYAKSSKIEARLKETHQKHNEKIIEMWGEVEHSEPHKSNLYFGDGTVLQSIDFKKGKMEISILSSPDKSEHKTRKIAKDHLHRFLKDDEEPILIKQQKEYLKKEKIAPQSAGTHSYDSEEMYTASDFLDRSLFDILYFGKEGPDSKAAQKQINTAIDKATFIQKESKGKESKKITTYTLEFPIDYCAIAESIYPAVKQNAEKFNIPASWIYAIIITESHFNPWAESYTGTAYGLMQIRPEFAGLESVKYFEYLRSQGLTKEEEKKLSELARPHKYDLFDEKYNILIGTAYINILYHKIDFPRYYCGVIPHEGNHHEKRKNCAITAYNYGIVDLAKYFRGSEQGSKKLVNIEPAEPKKTKKTMEALGEKEPTEIRQFIRSLRTHNKRGEEAAGYLEKVMGMIPTWDKILNDTRLDNPWDNCSNEELDKRQESIKKEMKDLWGE